MGHLSIKLGIKHPLKKWTQFFSKKGSCAFQREDINDIANKYIDGIKI